MNQDQHETDIAWRNLVESWLAGILPGKRSQELWRESWVAGLIHLSRGVRNVHLMSWMARLQHLFRGKCLEVFETERALEVSSAFDRITNTAVAIACEARETGLRQGISQVVQPHLFRDIETETVEKLLAASRGGKES
jgi:hypothetical protein